MTSWVVQVLGGEPMLIKNGTVVNANGQKLADVRIAGELISEVAPLLEPHEGEEVIDAQGMYVMPGGVDAHTHMDLQVGARRASDSFLTGTIAAACGGTTTIIDHMGFDAPGSSLLHQAEVYHGLADGNAVIDYGFHGIVREVNEARLSELPRLIEAGITSLKFYLTYDGRLDDEAILALLQHTGELDMLACVHCENNGIISYLKQKYLAEGKTAARYHALSRPELCEAEAVERMLKLAHVAGDAPLYIVHLSSAEGLAAAEPLPAHVYLETCPQYLTLDASCYDLPNHEGLKYVMSPPLRDASSREALWKALAEGTIEVVGTDHCPFFFTEKLAAGADDFTKCPNGMPGVELRLALMYSEGVVKRGMSPTTLVRICATTPAKRFGVYPRKGVIAVGSDADIVLFDPQRKLVVSQTLLHERVDYTPYEGRELQGYPHMTISRGKVIMLDGAFLGSKGEGRFLKRSLPDWT